MFALANLDLGRREVAPPRRPAPADDEIDTMQAELRAILVDLEFRAKYAKIEGAAVPLLVRAKRVNDDIRERLGAANDDLRRRFEPDFKRLNGQLRTVALAIAYLCRRGDVRAHG